MELLDSIKDRIATYAEEDYTFSENTTITMHTDGLVIYTKAAARESGIEKEDAKEIHFDKDGKLVKYFMEGDEKEPNREEIGIERAGHVNVLVKELENLYEANLYYPLREELDPILLPGYIPFYVTDDEKVYAINLRRNTLDITAAENGGREEEAPLERLPLTKVRERTKDFKHMYDTPLKKAEKELTR